MLTLSHGSWTAKHGERNLERERKRKLERKRETWYYAMYGKHS